MDAGPQQRLAIDRPEVCRPLRLFARAGRLAQWVGTGPRMLFEPNAHTLGFDRSFPTADQHCGSVEGPVSESTFPPAPAGRAGAASGELRRKEDSANVYLPPKADACFSVQTFFGVEVLRQA